MKRSALTLRSSTSFAKHLHVRQHTSCTIGALHFQKNQKRTSVWMSFSFFWRRHPDLNRGIADLQSTALPLGYGAIWSGRRGSNSLPPPWQGGALPDELRPQIWCPRSESNQRHADFQSAALPTELQGQTYAAADLVGTTGLEPVTLCL